VDFVREEVRGIWSEVEFDLNAVEAKNQSSYPNKRHIETPGNELDTFTQWAEGARPLPSRLRRG
jgi:hypothetical protein